MSKSLTTTSGLPLEAPIHPGEVLWQEFMAPLGLSQRGLAAVLQVPPGRISQVVKGQRAVTADTAYRLSLYFGTTAQFWLGLQAEYELDVVKAQLATHPITIARYEVAS
jgi:antitoxin HigA-1